MEKYDYFESVKEDIKEYIKDHDIIITEDIVDEIRDTLYDDMFISDSVTGNASGSYTFSTWKAEEYICHNLDLFAEAMEEFGYSDIPLDKICNAEYIDVTIRCYMLGQVIEEVLNNLITNRLKKYL